MNQPNEPISSQNAPDNEPPALDVLIGRIMDGEASVAQRQRFEAMAADDPGLWRALALRQQDMLMLGAHIEPRLNDAEKIELPEVEAIADQIESAAGERAADAFSRRLRVPWWIAVSGWAAMIAIAAAWSFDANWLNGVREHRSRSGGGQIASLTPAEHLREYKRAPYVLNEMQPTLLGIDDLPEGRLAVSYLRRIVEVAYFDSQEDIPLDGEGNLTHVPGDMQTPAKQTPTMD